MLGASPDTGGVGEWLRKVVYLAMILILILKVLFRFINFVVI